MNSRLFLTTTVPLVVGVAAVAARLEAPEPVVVSTAQR